jgi:hypothetical protein
LSSVNAPVSCFRSEPKVKWRSRQGLVPDEVSYFQSKSYGKNSYETLIFSGVLVFTDANLPIRKLEGKQYCCISTSYAGLATDCFHM